MADNRKKVNFSLKFVEPSAHLMTAARAFATSPDENRRSVAKALLDVTALGMGLKNNTV